MANNAIGFEFEIGDLEALKRIPREVREVLLDTEPVYEQAVHPFMLDFVKKVFGQKGDPTGTSWAGYGNEPKYAAYKAELLEMDDPEDRLMRWKGQERLYPSLRDKGHSLHVWKVDGFDAAFGTDVSYAARLAQEGGEGPFGESYPARPILTLSSRQETLLRKAISQTYRSRINRKTGASI